MSSGGNAAYDGRDDETTRITVDYIVADISPDGTAVSLFAQTVRYKPGSVTAGTPK